MNRPDTIVKRRSMHRHRIIIVALSAALAVFSAACTHKPTHPHKSDREWVIDHETCQKWVREGIRDKPDTYDFNDEMRLIRNCMRDKGWQWEQTGLLNTGAD
jgi:hypothetical protein